MWLLGCPLPIFGEDVGESERIDVVEFGAEEGGIAQCSAPPVQTFNGMIVDFDAAIFNGSPSALPNATASHLPARSGRPIWLTCDSMSCPSRRSSCRWFRPFRLRDCRWFWPIWLAVPRLQRHTQAHKRGFEISSAAAGGRGGGARFFRCWLTAEVRITAGSCKFLKILLNLIVCCRIPTLPDDLLKSR